MFVLQSSGVRSQLRTMELRSTKFRCIVTIKVLCSIAVIVFTLAPKHIAIRSSLYQRGRLKGKMLSCISGRLHTKLADNFYEGLTERALRNSTPTAWSQKDPVADSITERLTRPNAYRQDRLLYHSLSGILKRMTTQSFRCKTHAHIHTTVSEVIKKVFIQGFRTISENQCLLQILKVTMIGRRDIIKAFKDSNRYEHVRLKISVWQSLSERRSQKHETIVDENVEDPLATDSGIRLLGNVDLDQIMKVQQDDDAEITFMRATAFDQVVEEADSDVESMPDDEILSISRDDDKEDNFDRELPLADEMVADHVINEILNVVNKEDTHTYIYDVTPKEVSFVSVPQSASDSSLWDVQAIISKALREKKNIPQVKIQNVQALGAMKRFKEIQITKAPGSDPLGHLPQRLDFLAAQVHNLAKSLPNQFTEKMNSAASIVPRLVFNALAQELLDLLIATIKNTLPWALTKAHDGRCDLATQILHSSVKVPRDILVVNAKHLQTKVDITSADLHELVGLVSRVVNLRDTLAPSANVAAKGEKKSQSQPEKTIDDIQTTKVPTPAKVEPQTTEASVGQNSSALVVHSTDEIHEQPPSKKLKVVMEIPSIPNPVPLKSI
ncbi:hypothetical protein Tco_1301614 [Tanacetum coccineum]